MSHNHLDNPPRGKDLEVKGDRLDEQKEFMSGVMAAEHIKEQLPTADPQQRFAWGVLLILKDLNVNLEPDKQDLVLSNTRELYKCLQKDES